MITRILNTQSSTNQGQHDMDDLLHAMVHRCAGYDEYTNRYFVEIGSIPDEDLYELASVILAQNPSLASEATSFDNDMYEKYMLPKLCAYMANPQNEDAQIEFNQAWMTGIINYLHPMLTDMIVAKVDEMNEGQASLWSPTDTSLGHHKEF